MLKDIQRCKRQRDRLPNLDPHVGNGAITEGNHISESPAILRSEWEPEFLPVSKTPVPISTAVQSELCLKTVLTLTGRERDKDGFQANRTIGEKDDTRPEARLLSKSRASAFMAGRMAAQINLSTS